MQTITLISGSREIACTDPVYFARRDKMAAIEHVPSHLVAWPADAHPLDAICYVRLKREQVPVLVDPQPDGSIWIGGAYLDRIAGELMLRPRLLSDELAEKARAWQEMIGERWQDSLGQAENNAS